MLELNAGLSADDLIKDGSEATFMQDVVEMSQTVPVIVDFWAPWCGPCKTLGPALEAAVMEAGGAVKMVKLNVDENQATPAKYGVRGIPTMILFKGGEAVEQIVGNVPAENIVALIDKHNG